MQSPESLRAAALEALGAHADPRALELVERAWITVVPGVRQWAGSSGTVVAHTVRLEVDARALASLRVSPGLHDTLVVAFATAITRDPLHALENLEVYWGFELAGAGRGYRDGAEQAITRRDPVALAVALPVYVATRGEPAAAEALRKASIEVDGDTRKITVTVRLDPADAALFDRDVHLAELFDEAIHALLRDPAGTKVKTVRRTR